MRYEYAVIYQSFTGNTEKIAKAVYDAIESESKQIVSIDEMNTIPEAKVYFIGFNIHNDTCSIEIIDCLEQINGEYVALFSSCGYVPTEEYRKLIEDKIRVWLPDSSECLGLYVCQGRIQREQRERMIKSMPDKAEILGRMFEIGDYHPDEIDLCNAAEFSKYVQSKIKL